MKYLYTMNENNIFNKDFLDQLKNLELNQTEISSIYTYLAMFEEAMTVEEKAFWSIVLKEKDSEYDTNDETNDTAD